MTDPPTHYEILGVAPDAPAERIHAAYLDQARRHHPDRVGTGPDDRMQAVNEAWRVLGHPGRRRVYDADLAGAASTARATPAAARRQYADVATEMIDVAPSGGQVVMRFLPWAVVIGVLGVIFVFTAYASTGDRTDPASRGEDLLGLCVVITSARPTVAPIDCSVANDGQVVAEIDPSSSCPADTRAITPPDRDATLCLAG